MEREGVYEKYRNLNISEEVEAMWMSERKINIAKKLYSETAKNGIALLFSQYGQMVSQTRDENGLIFMLEYAKQNRIKLDSFTNIRIVETILNSTIQFDVRYKRLAINEALQHLINIKATTFYISNSYKENGIFPEYITENKIAERIDRNIKYCVNELKLM